MLNPDGVADGCYRTDSLGRNLNRLYLEATLEREPTIFASKALCHFYSTTAVLKLYLDLHAHANKKGMFCFGNSMDTIEEQVSGACSCVRGLLGVCEHLDVQMLPHDHTIIERSRLNFSRI